MMFPPGSKLTRERLQLKPNRSNHLDLLDLIVDVASAVSTFVMRSTSFRKWSCHLRARHAYYFLRRSTSHFLTCRKEVSRTPRVNWLEQHFRGTRNVRRQQRRCFRLMCSSVPWNMVVNLTTRQKSTNPCGCSRHTLSGRNCRGIRWHFCPGRRLPTRFLSTVHFWYLPFFSRLTSSFRSSAAPRSRFSCISRMREANFSLAVCTS